MPRILSSKASQNKGRPGFSKITNPGTRVSKNLASKFSVRRLMKRDPADAKTDPNAILGFTNDPDVPNTNRAPNPTVLRAPNTKKGNAQVPGVKHVRNRGPNRGLRRTQK